MLQLLPMLQDLSVVSSCSLVMVEHECGRRFNAVRIQAFSMSGN